MNQWERLPCRVSPAGWTGLCSPTAHSSLFKAVESPLPRGQLRSKWQRWSLLATDSLASGALEDSHAFRFDPETTPLEISPGG